MHVAWLAGRLDEVLAHARSTIDVSQQVWFYSAGTPVAHLFIGAVLIERGDWAEAIRVLEAALPETGSYRVYTLVLLAKARLEFGDTERACALAAEGLASAVAQRFGGFEVNARCVLAQTLLRTQGPAAREAIEVELARADAMIESRGIRAYAPFVLVERAALARALGDEAGHDRQLREARRLWLDIGATGWAERIAHQLGQETASDASLR